ncbi:GTPase Era [Mesoaciditoga lauensis]|uniref:GTPase Era n=1 Tax=Mesoaciditoga lauensis TaxID=1495039 RepID=UPI00055EC364|nr:GTPase Era [Mesoaciditoga lauensis]
MKAGFVCLAGAPNVGKSSIVNAYLGKKISIVSEKPQTTRNRINAILNLPDAQVVFVDTPGIHKPVHKLGNYLVKIAIKALEGNDLLLFVVSAERFGEFDRIVAERIKASNTPFIGVINKMDRASKQNVEKAEELFKSMDRCLSIKHVSAIRNEGLDELLKNILDNLPESPAFYPPDMITDKPLRFMVAEIIREKIFALTHQELPYSTAVSVDYVEESPTLIKIWCTILVERNSQKPILLGKGGKMIKKIGTLARKDIENLLDAHVFLSLHVKVKEKWTENDRNLNELFKDEL